MINALDRIVAKASDLTVANAKVSKLALSASQRFYPVGSTANLVATADVVGSDTYVAGSVITGTTFKISHIFSILLSQAGTGLTIQDIQLYIKFSHVASGIATNETKVMISPYAAAEVVGDAPTIDAVDTCTAKAGSNALSYANFTGKVVTAALPTTGATGIKVLIVTKASLGGETSTVEVANSCYVDVNTSLAM